MKYESDKKGQIEEINGVKEKYIKRIISIEFQRDFPLECLNRRQATSISLNNTHILEATSLVVLALSCLGPTVLQLVYFCFGLLSVLMTVLATK
jgi:hypothetical protein